MWLASWWAGVFPSGAKVRIWGDDPRWRWKRKQKLNCCQVEKYYTKFKMTSSLSTCFDALLSKLLCDETLGVRQRRGCPGYDIDWCCSEGEFGGWEHISKGIFINSAVTAWTEAFWGGCSFAMLNF